MVHKLMGVLSSPHWPLVKIGNCKMVKAALETDSGVAVDEKLTYTKRPQCVDGADDDDADSTAAILVEGTLTQSFSSNKMRHDRYL